VKAEGRWGLGRCTRGIPPSLQSQEAGRSKEEQKGFFQIQHEECSGSVEETCLSLIWAQPGFKQCLCCLITKSLWPFRGCFVLTKASCLQAALPWVYEASARRTRVPGVCDCLTAPSRAARGC